MLIQFDPWIESQLAQDVAEYARLLGAKAEVASVKIQDLPLECRSSSIEILAARNKRQSSAMIQANAECPAKSVR